MAEKPDPAVEAFELWRTVFAVYLAILDRHDVPDNSTIIDAVEKAAHAAALALAKTVPTTPAGIAVQLRFAFYALGEAKERFDDSDGVDAYTNPDNVDLKDTWTDQRGALVMRSLLAGAERLARKSR